jgi:hypothetical protein
VIFIIPKPAFNMTTSLRDSLNFPTVSLHDLRDSVTELGFRPSYDLLWGQLTSEMMNAVEKMKEEGGDLGEECVTAIMPVWRLIEHIKEEIQVIRRAVNRVLVEVTNNKEHEHLVKRKRYESLKNKALNNAAVAAAAVSANAVSSSSPPLN